MNGLLSFCILLLLSILAIDNSQAFSSSSNANANANNDFMSIQGSGVCRVEIARVDWDPLQPWQRTAQTKSSGTAFVIEGERLLTNAHVVKSAIDIRVRPHGSTRRFPARVVCYAPDVDLALLEILGDSEAADFFGHVPSEQHVSKKRKIVSCLEFATDLPALQETIHVVGFPTGGRTICVTEGVVSRIDLYHKIVAIQVDSAINPGNSGGPAFNSKGQVTGVAFRKRVSTKSQKVDNIGYLIPAVVVKAFLGRVDRDKGTYRLSGTIPYRCHTLENHSLRLAHKVPDDIHGVLITSVAEEPNDDDDDAKRLLLRPGDILTKVDESPVADDGQVVLRGDELIQHAYLMRIKQPNEPVIFTVYRDGHHVVCDPYYLEDIRPIIPRWENVDYMPNYMILGSLVLLPLSLDMRHFKQCGHLLKADCIESYRKWPREWDQKEGLVILTEIFAHELTFSYNRPWRRVVSYNGQAVKSLRHLQDLWTESCASLSEDDKHEPTFARLELENDDDIVLEVRAAKNAQDEVMATHAIPKPYNILPPNPDYI